jgi:alkanesulfonate monooxygenase SsuD/methylene tetrahydromethanopterin reductase-like flavin-dependent oxidoreductase (luciferase family)
MDFPASRVKSWTAAGSVDQCIEHLRVFEAMGFHEVTLRIAGWDQLGQLERVMREVVPRLLR